MAAPNLTTASSNLGLERVTLKGDAFGSSMVYASADYVLAVIASQLFNGVGSAALKPPLVLNRNTIVRKYDLRIRAAHAPRTQAQNVAQVRAYSSGAKNTVVIDFGTPRTVSYLSVPSGIKVLKVSSWAGAQFGYPFYPGASGGGSTSSAAFPSEVRTERLLLELDKSPSSATVGTDIVLEIPDLPGDIELRINDGNPVWRNPGEVQPTSGLKIPTMGRWSEESERIVPLADALNALASDATADAEETFNIVLTSKVPGNLSVTADPAPLYSHIHRIDFSEDASTDLEFLEEGLQAVPLPLPAAPPGRIRKIEEVRLTLVAKLPPERVLPPVGPAWVPAPAGNNEPVLAELALDPAHAACVRLGASALAELTGVRLPLVAPPEGAEVRVTLWSADAVTGEPVEPLPGGTSDPITLSGRETHDSWNTFAFAKPVPLEKNPEPWAAILATRGSATWSFAAAPAIGGVPGSDSALIAASRLLRGGPDGPWRPLPSPFQAPPPSGVIDARGRVRAVGLGSKTQPVAPLLLSLEGTAVSAVEATPTAKGVQLTLSFNPPAAIPAADPVLALVSRVGGTVTLRDIDVVWRDE